MLQFFKIPKIKTNKKKSYLTNNLISLDGRPLEEHSSDSHFKILNDHSLLIESPREDDSGIYKCTVSTSLDRSDKSIEVLIEDVPPAVQSASIAVCNKDNFIVRIKFEHVEQAYRPKPVREFWIRYLLYTQSYLVRIFNI